MPAALTHLAAANDLLTDPKLSSRLGARVQARRAAFLLGNIGPDVRAVSGLAREATHFFGIPPSGNESSHHRLLERWPGLADASRLAPEHAAFVAGYIAHLVMDEAWADLIVMRFIYTQGIRWGRDHPGFRLYSLLMLYLDTAAAAHLPPDTGEVLAEARPDGWLPFASDADLAAWRDHVAVQARDEGVGLVTRMFAKIMGVSPEELSDVVASEARMQAEVFERVPRRELDRFQRTTHARSRQALCGYLGIESG
jgi:hypothetical protein